MTRYGAVILVVQGTTQCCPWVTTEYFGAILFLLCTRNKTFLSVSCCVICNWLAWRKNMAVLKWRHILKRCLKWRLVSRSTFQLHFNLLVRRNFLSPCRSHRKLEYILLLPIRATSENLSIVILWLKIWKTPSRVNNRLVLFVCCCFVSSFWERYQCWCNWKK